MDDANVPSLISLPYLDGGSGELNATLYAATRRWVLSRRNEYYYCGANATDACGVGSPHTQPSMVWPMGLLTAALTARSAKEVVGLVELLLETDDGTDLMHESLNLDRPSEFTRPWFDWCAATAPSPLTRRSKLE